MATNNKRNVSVETGSLGQRATEPNRTAALGANLPEIQLPVPLPKPPSVRRSKTEQVRTPVAVRARKVPQNAKIGHETLYFNRELSWLDFNWRVLAQAKDERWPILERIKFLAMLSCMGTFLTTPLAFLPIKTAFASMAASRVFSTVMPFWYTTLSVPVGSAPTV